MKKSTEHKVDQLYEESFREANVEFDKSGMWRNMRSSVPGNYNRRLFWTSLITAVLLLIYGSILFYWEEKSPAKLAEQPSSNQAVVPQLISPVQEQSERTPRTEMGFLNPIQDNQQNDPVVGVDRSSDEKETQNSFGESPPNTASYTSKNTSAEPAPDRQKSNSLDNSELRTVQSPDQTENNQLSVTSKERTLSRNERERAVLKAPTFRKDLRAEKLSILNPDPLETEQDLLPKDPTWSLCNVGGRPLRFFSEVYAFGGYPFIDNSINQSAEPQSEGFLNDWNESEQAVGSYALGLLFGIGTHWGGSISAGIEYQQVINKVTREQTVIEQITVYDEMAYFYLDSNNNKVWVADSVTSTRIYQREVQRKKTHTLVNIPVSLAYHLERGRWRFGINAGVNLHLYKRFDGTVLDPSGQFVDASTDGNFEVYDTDMSFSLIGGLDLGYIVGDHMELYVSPRFRFHSDSWLDESHPLESHIQLVGLRGGARYHF